MSQSLSLSTLQEIKKVMEDMLVQTVKENWEAFAQLDESRRVLLDYKPLEPPAQAVSDIFSPSESSAYPSVGNAHSTPVQSTEYTSLCNSILELDKDITHAVQRVRQSLVEEKRGLQAQVAAKKGYAQACSSQCSSFG